MVTNWKQKLITLLILLIVISGAMQLMITMQHGNDLQDTYNVAADHENNLRSKRDITYVSAKTTKTMKRKRRKKRKKRTKNNAGSSANKKDVAEVPLTRLENDPTRFKQLNTELHLLKTENARLKQREHQSNTTISNKNNQIEELKQQVKLSNQAAKTALSTTQSNGVKKNLDVLSSTIWSIKKKISSNQILRPHPPHRTHQTGKLTVDRKNLKAPDGSHNFENWKQINFNSCAVVGSGPSLLNSGYGTDIDNHDAVFRINSAPTKGFHSDVGSFTTFRVSYGITCLHAAMTGKHSKIENN